MRSTCESSGTASRRSGKRGLNVAYLNGLAADQLIRKALDLLTEFDLAAAIDAGTVAVPLAAASAPLRMMVDIALHDWAAKRRAVPLASLLARGPAAEPVRSQTNQTLFISDEATFLGRAEAYVARGFRDLKVRIGAGNFADDLKRLRLLRTRFGDAVDLAADANGAWELEQARANLAELAPLDLALCRAAGGARAAGADRPPGGRFSRSDHARRKPRIGRRRGRACL